MELVAPADLVIHLEVEPGVAYRRIGKAREPLADESPLVLESFRRGYESSLRLFDCPVLRIRSDDLADTVDAIARAIRQTLTTRSDRDAPAH